MKKKREKWYCNIVTLLRPRWRWMVRLGYWVWRHHKRFVQRAWSLHFRMLSLEVLKLDFGASVLWNPYFHFKGFTTTLLGSWFILMWGKERLKEEDSPLFGIVCPRVVLGQITLYMELFPLSVLLPTLWPEANSPAEVENLLGEACQSEVGFL